MRQALAEAQLLYFSYLKNMPQHLSDVVHGACLQAVKTQERALQEARAQAAAARAALGL